MIVVGLIISCVGLGIHASPYSAADSGIKSISAAEQTTKILKFPPIQDSYYIVNFQISWFNSTESEIKFVWINQSEYDRYILGNPIENLRPIILLNPTIELVGNETTIAFNGTFYRSGNATEYIVMINNSNMTKTYMYFYSTITPAYNSGWIYLMYGIFLTFGVLIYYTQGPRRWFFIGVLVNLLFFLTRIALLSKNYSAVAFGSGWTESNPEIYSDFQYYTIQWTNQIRQGVLPYTTEMSTYIFPPLFVLTMFLFDFLPLPVWRLGLPLIGAIIGIGIILWRILEIFFPDKQKERSISLALALYFLNPLVLFYGSFAWLNPPLFMFWTILSIYFMLKRKPTLSIGLLGIACMYKQFAAILFPLIFFIIWKPNRNEIKKSIFQAISYLSAFILPILIISLPFLIISPSEYLSRVLIGNTSFDLDRLVLARFDPSWPVSISGTLAYAGAPPWIIYGTAYLDIHYILLGGSCLIVFLRELHMINKFTFDYSSEIDTTTGDNKRKMWELFFNWIIVLILLTQIFYPRGTYKYYLMFLTPYLAIFISMIIPRIIEVKNKANSSRKRETFEKQLVGFVILGLWIVVFFNRFLYFWLLIGWIGMMMGYYFWIQRKSQIPTENVA